VKISQIMKRAYVVDENITLKEAAKIMSNKKIGGLIVLNGDKISGIITERNIINNLQNINSKISKFMARKIISVSSDDEVNNAAKLMTQNKIKRLPVIDNGKLVGIVRITDVVGKSEAIEQGNFFFN